MSIFQVWSYQLFCPRKWKCCDRRECTCDTTLVWIFDYLWYHKWRPILTICSWNTLLLNVMQCDSQAHTLIHFEDEIFTKIGHWIRILWKFSSLHLIQSYIVITENIFEKLAMKSRISCILFNVCKQNILLAEWLHYKLTPGCHFHDWVLVSDPCECRYVDTTRRLDPRTS